MKYIITLLSVSCFCIACSALPEVILTEGSVTQNIQRQCLDFFPKGNWQFVHRIEATFPGGKKSQVVGITTLSSDTRSVRCIIMTIEGLVVFDASYDRQITINRGIAPFDSMNFARGLLDDIQLIFFPPEGLPTLIGKLHDGTDICRYQKPNHQTVDILCLADQSRLLRRYDAQKRIDRTLKIFFRVKGNSVKPDAWPYRLEFEAHGSPGYALSMDLMEAAPLPQ